MDIPKMLREEIPHEWELSVRTSDISHRALARLMLYRLPVEWYVENILEGKMPLKVSAELFDRLLGYWAARFSGDGRGLGHAIARPFLVGSERVAAARLYEETGGGYIRAHETYYWRRINYETLWRDYYAAIMSEETALSVALDAYAAGIPIEEILPEADTINPGYLDALSAYEYVARKAKRRYY